MSNKFFSAMMFLSLFMLEAQVFSDKNKSEPTKDKNGEFFVKTEYADFSRAFLEQAVLSFKKYPARCVLACSALLGYGLYSEEIQKFIKEHRDTVFISGVASAALAYFNKSRIMKYFPDEEDEFEDDDLGNVSSENAILNFSKVPVRVYRAGEIVTTFEHVAGLEAAKEDLMDVVMFLKNSSQFDEIGAKIPKGILLHGSPGNGKTLIARAVAGEVQCPFLYVNASEFEEAFVGIGAARIRHLFAIAKELAPCIIFIDEIDSVGRQRSVNSLSSAEGGQTLNQLLSEMDGFEQSDEIVIIAATNRPDVLDSALVRPGRFDRKIEISTPFIHDRYNILKLHLGNVKTVDDIDVYKIARGTPGYSGAELAHLINEAAILALRDGKGAVSMLHIDQARDYINLGRETKGMDISDEEYWKTAVHEAGHALARVFQSDAIPLHKVTITPRGGALGLTFGMEAKERHSRYEQEFKAEIVVRLAGSVAEELIFKGRGAGASSDLKSARDLATQMVMMFGMTEEFKDVTFAEYIHAQVHLPDEIATKLQNEVTKIIHECRQVAVELISSHKKELTELVDMLLAHGTVFGSDVYKLCEIEEPNLEYSLAL